MTISFKKTEINKINVHLKEPKTEHPKFKVSRRK